MQARNRGQIKVNLFDIYFGHVLGLEELADVVLGMLEISVRMEGGI